MRTQASIPYSFGKSKFIMLSILTSFEIHYPSSSCVGTWHSDPLPLCVGTWHSDPLYVSERDTPIPYMCRYVTLRSPISTCRFVTPVPLILCVGTWHSDPLILCVGTWHSDPLILCVGTWHSDPLNSFYPFIKPSLYQGITNPITLIHQAFFYTKASSLIT